MTNGCGFIFLGESLRALSPEGERKISGSVVTPNSIIECRGQAGSLV
jgi:hypothetical protein